MTALLLLFTWLSCAQEPEPPPELASLERRIVALEEENRLLRESLAGGGAGEGSSVGLRGLELRLQDLEQRVGASPTFASPADMAMPQIEADP